MPVIGLVAYLVAFFVTMWTSYWGFVGFVFLSPFIATIVAFRELEYWPVVHPTYGFYWTIPAIFVAWQMALNHPLEWAQWLGWSLLVAATITAIWLAKLRRHIDREWAVLGTFAAVLVLTAFGLNIANINIGGQSCKVELATIVSSSPSGYRRPAHITVATASHERQTFVPGLLRYFDLHDASAICVVTYEGALGWSWEMLDACTDAEIEASLPD